APTFRRHGFYSARHWRFETPARRRAPRAEVVAPRVAPAKTSSVQGNGLVGGPRQISVQLKPWQPSVRHTALTARKLSGHLDRFKDRKEKTAGVPAHREPDRELTPLAEPDFESVGPVVEQTPQIPQAAISESAEMVTAPGFGEVSEVPEIEKQEPNEFFEPTEEATVTAKEANEFSGDEKEEITIEEEQSEPLGRGEFALPPIQPSTEFAVEPMSHEQ